VNTATLAAQSGNQAGAHHGRFAAAGCADHGDKVLALGGEAMEQIFDEALAAEEERGVFFVEILQAAIGIDVEQFGCRVGGISRNRVNEAIEGI
jgi:hypothetical protein